MAVGTGTFTVAADGTWSFTADNDAIQSLGEGVTATETFTVTSIDGTEQQVTVTLTGAQIDTLLGQQFDNPSVGSNRILQPSVGFAYSWSAGAPTGSKVDIASITIGGVPICDFSS